MTRSAAQRTVPDDDQPMSNGCPQVQAMDRQTEALDRQTAAIVALQPAADAIADLGQAQKKLCNFLVTNRMKLTGGVIAALVAVGAISPNMAGIIGRVLHAAGAM